MLKRFSLLIAVALVPALAFCQGNLDELKKMQGTWNCVVEEEGGKQASDEEKKELILTLVIEGDGYKTYFNDKLLTSGNLRVDATKSPMAIDALPKDGPYAGKVQLGVFKWDGEVMFANFAKPGDTRPTNFKTRADSEDALVRYVRKKS